MPKTALKYLQLQESIKQELASGAFHVGDLFYTEKEVMEKYNVSYITASRAMKEMAQSGYFERKRKIGTIVLGSQVIPGMSGNVMTRCLYVSSTSGEPSQSHDAGPSWFVVDKMREGIINSYPGMVKLLPVEEIVNYCNDDPDGLAIFTPQFIENYAEKLSRRPKNSIEIWLPPYLGSFVNCVRPNYMIGVYDAMSHLIALGHRRIGYLGNRYLKNRYAAYRIALETNEIPLCPELVYFKEETAISYAEGAEYAHDYLSLPKSKRPTALFCSTDKLALGAMRELLKSGIRIPEDLSIIGFDDIPESQSAPVPLSTVHVSYSRIGQIAVEMLLDKIKTGRDIPTRTTIAYYIPRDSVSIPRK